MTNTLVIEKLIPEIERTIKKLDEKIFKTDPLAGAKLSRITSIMSSAYKRHGFIIEKSILESINANQQYVAWEERRFHVSKSADHMIDSIIDTPERADATELPYIAGHRTLQVDLVVYNKVSKHISSYEVKRGNGKHDSGKTRSILRDLLCQKVLISSYAKSRGLRVDSSDSKIIFYYGQRSKKLVPFSIMGSELDQHFGFEIQKNVEDVNLIFRDRLNGILGEIN